jgi:uncharacterized protein YgbK (DUF1537 family)
MQWIIVADDLTGACDSGAVFAAAGLRAQVFLSPPDWETVSGDLDVAVVSTESRVLPVAEAVRAVKAVLRGAPREARIYKKIDSPLRGHPAEEFFAVLEAVEASGGLVCPAFPEQARTVVDGQVLVNGRPLAETHFGAEVRNGDLRVLFSAQAVSLAEVGGVGMLGGESNLMARLAAPEVLTADAVTDEDLQRLARAGLGAGLRVFCGSAGLARALAGMGAERIKIEGIEAQNCAPKPVLVIAGSRNPVTRRQVEFLTRSGGEWVILGLDSLRIANRDRDVSRNLEAPIQALLRILCNRGTAVLVTEPVPQPDPLRAAQLLALVAARALAEVSPAGLVLSGGDTAAAVCRELGCTAVDLGGEVLPGLAWGRMVDGAFRGMAVVTKAGGFGDENALLRAVHFLANCHPLLQPNM